MGTFKQSILAAAAALSLNTAIAHADDHGLDLKFAGALEITDDGTLFVGDNYNGAIYAFQLPKTKKKSTADPVTILDVDAKIADMLGVGESAIEINDMAVSPKSQEVYISVSRIGGFASQPAIVKVTQEAELELLDLASLSFEKQALNEFPESETTFHVRGLMGKPPSTRDIAKGEIALSSLAIMDMEFHDGELFVAGVAHDNFLSSLRRVSYPFDGTQSLTNVEVYHIAHDQYETRAPIRAMTIQEVDGKEQLVAAYTCSPIVLIPLEEITDGAKISANSIADMGNGQPLDMIPYALEGRDLLFISHNSRSPQVVPLNGLNNAKVVTHEDFERGPKMDLNPIMPFGPVGQTVMFDGIPLHMDLLGDTYFVSLTRDAYTGSLNLESNPTFFPNRVHNLVAEFDFPQWHEENDYR
ncbi:MAG: hypothetical protein AAGC77_00380 [Pseudomonadota bacterium]